MNRYPADAQGQASREATGASGSMKALQTTVSNLATDIGQVLIPIITPLIQRFTEWINKFKELDAPTQQLIVKIGLLVAVLGPALVVIGTLITSIGSIGTALGGLFTFIAANPIVLIIGAIVAAVALLIANWDWVKEKASQLWSSLTQTFNNIKTTISDVWNSIWGTTVKKWNGIKNAIETPINKAKEIVRNAINTIKGLFNFKFTWPKLKMPHFSISGSINPFSPNFPPKVGVDWYAQGGIFDSPSVIGVGEAGSEAVVPTNKLDKFLADGVSRVLQGLDGTNGKGDIVINVKEMNVREDSDIRRVAEEVQRLIDLKMSRVSNAGGLL